MPETTEQTADRLATAAQNSFNEFGAALQGSGADAYRDWAAVQNNVASLTRLSRDTASGIRNLQENEAIPDFERWARIAELNSLSEGLMRSVNKDLQDSVAKVEDSLLEALRPAFPETSVDSTTAGDRQLVRSEIDQLVAAATPAPGKPGQPMLSILMGIAKQSPAYAAEIVGNYGKVKMMAAGEHQFAADLPKNVMRELASVPGGTPKAQSAKRALSEMARLQVKGHIPGLTHAAKFRVEAANTPAKPVGPPAWQPDTLIPRR